MFRCRRSVNILSFLPVSYIADVQIQMDAAKCKSDLMRIKPTLHVLMTVGKWWKAQCKRCKKCIEVLSDPEKLKKCVEELNKKNPTSE